MIVNSHVTPKKTESTIDIKGFLNVADLREAKKI